jgi:hypothetical protein
VVFCDFVGARLLANVASSTLARESLIRENKYILLVAFGKLAGCVTPVVEAAESSEPLLVVTTPTSVCASELVQLDDTVIDAETAGTVTSSALESPLSVPTKTCCTVDAPITVVTLSGKMVAAAVATALARTKSLAERIVVDFRDREAESWQ